MKWQSRMDNLEKLATQVIQDYKKKNKNKNTTLFLFDITMFKQTQIM